MPGFSRREAEGIKMRHFIVIVALLFVASSAAFALDADILLIDDAGAEQLSSFYGPLCLNARRTYQEWNVSQAGAVPATMLDAFPTVIWLAGHNPAPSGIEGGAATLLARLGRGGRAVLIGDHLAGALPEVMQGGFGLAVKHFNPILGQMKGRLPDVVSQGQSLDLSAPGAETADYASDGDDAASLRPEVVFWATDRGVSRFTGARIEKLGEGASRATWFGFDLSGTKNPTRASEVFTRAVLWTTPEPPARPAQQNFQRLWTGK